MAQPLAWLVSDGDTAAGGDGFDGVEGEIGDDFVDLLGVQHDFRQRRKLLLDFHAGSGRAMGQGAGDDFVQVDFDGLDLEAFAQEAEAADKVINMVAGLADAAQRVGAKLGISKCTGKFLSMRFKVEARVLKIVDKESGHGLEGFHFFVLKETFGEASVQERRGDLVGHAMEHVEILQREADAADAISKGDQTEKVAAGDHGGARASAAGAEFDGVTLAEGLGPRGAGGFEHFGFVMLLEMADDFASFGSVWLQLPAGGFGEGRWKR